MKHEIKTERTITLTLTEDEAIELMDDLSLENPVWKVLNAFAYPKAPTAPVETSKEEDSVRTPEDAKYFPRATWW